jgi:hypothetical protein
MVESEKPRKEAEKSTTTTETTTPKKKSTSRLAKAVLLGATMAATFNPFTSNAAPTHISNSTNTQKVTFSQPKQASKVESFAKSNTQQGMQQNSQRRSGDSRTSVGINLNNSGGRLSISTPHFALSIGTGFGQRPEHRQAFFSNFAPNYMSAEPVSKALVRDVASLASSNPNNVVSYVSNPDGTMVYVERNGTVIQTDKVMPQEDGSAVILKTVYEGNSVVISAFKMFELGNGQTAIQAVNPAPYQ